MAPAPCCTVTGAGLGLRRALLGPLSERAPDCVDFFEVAPENWMDIGGRLGRQFRAFTERHSMLCHGLSLNLGGPAPLDETFLRQLKRFMSEHGVALYSEHLSYCADDGHLFDLMPIPFTEEAVHHVAARIRRSQDILEQRIAVENVSYYAAPGKEMDEPDFVRAVVEEADCDLLLDINNVYVNGANHGYDPWDFIRAMPADRIAYLHIAGHSRQGPDLIIDTHGAAVIDPVWDLLGKTYGRFGVIPTLLERDFDLPPLAELLEEVESIARHQYRWSPSHEHCVENI